jgi:hypothetical protein
MEPSHKRKSRIISSHKLLPLSWDSLSRPHFWNIKDILGDCAIYYLKKNARCSEIFYVIFKLLIYIASNVTPEEY